MQGYFLLYESMLGTVLYARDRYLRPETGIMLPDKVSLCYAELYHGVLFCYFMINSVYVVLCFDDTPTSCVCVLCFRRLYSTFARSKMRSIDETR